jgi:16S rRNA (guanine(966)-N(2))-methyltransferase RsmD
MLRGQIMRVIAGEYGGRRLEAPRGLRTRPTSDRVREALFMSLGELDSVRVVDLFAGSGALGIEALSRGALFVHFVDSDRNARDTLARNLATLGADDRSKIWPLTLPRGLARLEEELLAADLVLADPPYGGADACAVLAVLGRPGALRTGTRVVVERHQKDELPETAGALVLGRERRYGETVVNLYDVRTLSSPEAGIP